MEVFTTIKRIRLADQSFVSSPLFAPQSPLRVAGSSPEFGILLIIKTRQFWWVVACICYRVGEENSHEKAQKAHKQKTFCGAIA